MALIESLENALHSKVKRKANRTGNLKSHLLAKAKRVSGGAPEVLVKITGFGKGRDHIKAHVDYISRHGKQELENDRGEVLSGKSEIEGFFKGWSMDFSAAHRRKNQRDTMHMVLSMPETTDPQAVKEAVRSFAKHTFGHNHEYVFVLHSPDNDPKTKQPHCHLAVKCRGFDDVWLNPRKADLQEWRERFSEELRELGVDAEATPRISRGVTLKAKRSVIKHIEQGDKTHKPRIPKVEAAKIKEAALELTKKTGSNEIAKPWEEFIRNNLNTVRSGWLAVADAIERNNINITFNKIEAHNERPEYDRFNEFQARSAYRAAAIYQSDIAKLGRRTPPETVTGLRNVSNLDVVHDKQSTEMLLRKNALNFMDRGGAADHEMRRARAGVTGALAAIGKLTEEDVKEHAAKIRVFVENALPSSGTFETEREQLKRKLRQQFTIQPDKNKAQTVIVQQKGADAIMPSQAPAKDTGKDVER